MLVLKVPQEHSVMLFVPAGPARIIEVKVTAGHENTKIGFSADRDIKILRKELMEGPTDGHGTVASPPGA